MNMNNLCHEMPLISHHQEISSPIYMATCKLILIPKSELCKIIYLYTTVQSSRRASDKGGSAQQQREQQGDPSARAGGRRPRHGRRAGVPAGGVVLPRRERRRRRRRRGAGAPARSVRHSGVLVTCR